MDGYGTFTWPDGRCYDGYVNFFIMISMWKIKSMDLGISHMLMEQCIKAIGLTVKNMDKEHSIQKVGYIEKGNGLMVKE